MEDSGCTLISSSNTHVTYLAQCGHENTTSIKHFKRGHGRLCKHCVYREDDAVIIDRIKQDFQIIKQNYTYYVRPLLEGNAWLPIKITISLHTNNFHIRTKNIVYIMYNVSSDSLWVQYVYDKPIINNATKILDVHAELLKIYKTHEKVEHLVYTQRQPSLTSLCGDVEVLGENHFMCGARMYHDSVASKTTRGYQVYIHQNCSCDDVIIHIPDKDYFYVIPRSLIKTTHFHISIHKHSTWYQPYKHRYSVCSFQFDHPR